jgi:hypothetical protein
VPIFSPIFFSRETILKKIGKKIGRSKRLENTLADFLLESRLGVRMCDAGMVGERSGARNVAWGG